MIERITVERITVAEAHARMRAQGVTERQHVAFVCPVCTTVQSMASLVRAGASAGEVERYIGFSCEGRFTGAGPLPGADDRTAAAEERRQRPGCDWSLGGLFSLHKLEVTTDDGSHRPSFEIATPEQAQALEELLASASNEGPVAAALVMGGAS